MPFQAKRADRSTKVYERDSAARTSSEPQNSFFMMVAALPNPVQAGRTDARSANTKDPEVQYRALLDEPVPMLGDVTSRAAARIKAGRDRLAAWLKHLENMSERVADPTGPMATCDFIWLWRERGDESLRRWQSATVNPSRNNAPMPGSVP